MKNKLYIYINNLYRQVYIDLKNTIFMETANEKTEKENELVNKIENFAVEYRNYSINEIADFIVGIVRDYDPLNQKRTVNFNRFSPTDFSLKPSTWEKDAKKVKAYTMKVLRKK